MKDTNIEVSLPALLLLCRHTLSFGGRLRYWQAGPHTYTPTWIRPEWPNLFCDAELFVLEHKKGDPKLGACWRAKADWKVRGITREAVLVFEHRSLYRYTFQLRAVEIDGAPAKVI